MEFAFLIKGAETTSETMSFLAQMQIFNFYEIR